MMPDFLAIPVEDYLAQLASGEPIPGGGSAAALTGAMGAALLCMSARFTIGKEKYLQFEQSALQVEAEADTIRLRLQQSVEKDSEAYGGYGAALALPKGSDDEKALRTTALQNASKASALAPLDIARNCYRLLQLAVVMAENCNPNLVSDVIVAAELAVSGFRSAVLNVRMNLPYIKDEQFVLRIRAELSPLVATAAEIATQALQNGYQVINMPSEGV